MAKASYPAITLASMWNCKIEADNLFGLNGSPFEQASVGQPLMSATLAGDAGVLYGDPVVHDPTDPPFGGPPGSWEGKYLEFTASVSVLTAPVSPPVSQTYFVWVGDVFDIIPPDVFGPGLYVTDGAGKLSLDAELSMSEMYMVAQSADDVPTDRGFLWFGDRNHAEAWFVPVGATATATIGITTKTGDVTLSTGTGDVGFELSGNYRASTLLSCRSFAGPGATYARIADIAWGNVDTSLAKLDLYNPGDAGFIPDAVNAAGWSRVATVADRARVGNDNGMGMWAEGTYIAAAAWVGIIAVPYQVTFQPLDGKFAYN